MHILTLQVLLQMLLSDFKYQKFFLNFFLQYSELKTSGSTVSPYSVNFVL